MFSINLNITAWKDHDHELRSSIVELRIYLANFRNNLFPKTGNVMQFLEVVRVARSPIQPARLENQGDWSTAEVVRVNLRTLSDRMEKVIYGSSLAARDKTNSSWKNESKNASKFSRFSGSFILGLRFEKL